MYVISTTEDIQQYVSMPAYFSVWICGGRSREKGKSSFPSSLGPGVGALARIAMYRFRL